MIKYIVVLSGADMLILLLSHLGLFIYEFTMGSWRSRDMRRLSRDLRSGAFLYHHFDLSIYRAARKMLRL